MVTSITQQYDKQSDTGLASVRQCPEDEEPSKPTTSSLDPLEFGGSEPLLADFSLGYAKLSHGSTLKKFQSSNSLLYPIPLYDPAPLSLFHATSTGSEYGVDDSVLQSTVPSFESSTSTSPWNWLGKLPSPRYSSTSEGIQSSSESSIIFNHPYSDLDDNATNIESNEKHFGAREIICEICNKYVNGNSAFRKHQRTHTKPEICAVSGCKGPARFAQARDLHRHMIVAHNQPIDKPLIECTLCSKSFARHDNLRRHLKKFHGNINHKVEEYSRLPPVFTTQASIPADLLDTAPDSSSPSTNATSQGSVPSIKSTSPGISVQKEAQKSEPVRSQLFDSTDSAYKNAHPNPSLEPVMLHEFSQLVPVDVLQSDSGYGTASCDTSKQKPVVMISEDSTIPPNSQLPDGSLAKEGLKSPVELRDDDQETIYTDPMSLSDIKTETYISALSENLYKRLDQVDITRKGAERILKSLPDLLKAMAFNIGYKAKSQIYLDMMVFIHKFRVAITSSLRSKLDSVLEGDHGGMGAKKSKNPRSMEIMNRFMACNEVEYEEFPSECVDMIESIEVDIDGLEDDEEFTFPEIEEYSKIISGDPGYDWLLKRLWKETTLETVEQGCDSIAALRKTILEALPKTIHASRRQPAQGVEITYVVDWDILAFLAEQCYDEPPTKAIAGAVTITGSCTDAQAQSCSKYLAQTWPSTGGYILQLIQDLLKRKIQGTSASLTTACGLIITASIKSRAFVVKVSGIAELAAEIGEQLSWLGAALRCSPHDANAIYCTPYADMKTSIPKEVPRAEGPIFLECHIKYKFEVFEELHSNINGQCWHHLFNRPVVARGFPIPLRTEQNTGLEISLSLLAALCQTRYINKFGSKILIKGFSTMLVPTKRAEDNTMIWHLLYNRNPKDRISYLDCKMEHVDVKLSELEASRHILGWCSDAVCNVGSRKANYSVKKSRLPYAHATTSLDKVEISGGQFVMATAAFSLGNREKPVHISRPGYQNKLQWISSKYFVLWDQGEKRGTLVNGASALLHILRGSIEHSKNKFSADFLLDPQRLADVDEAASPGSALKFLIDQRNRDLRLYVDKSEDVDVKTVDDKANPHIVSSTQRQYYRLEDRVEHIYNTLEKLIDHKIDLEQRNGLQVKPRLRRHLEGFDFKDLVTDGDPFFSRVATIGIWGKGWVDFTRAIRAVTLFGRGFGELIQPRKTGTDPCSRWSSVPTGRYYLSSLVSDLEAIMEDDGDVDSSPMRLCQDILWHMKQSTFMPCPCTSGSSHHDPVQVLFPYKFLSKFSKKQPKPLESRGAVIFGHNMKVHWHWRDSGDPVKGDPPNEEAEAIDIDSFVDSGLGSSLGSSRDTSSAVSSPDEPYSSSEALEPVSCFPGQPQDGQEYTGTEQVHVPTNTKSSKRKIQDSLSSLSESVKKGVKRVHAPSREICKCVIDEDCICRHVFT